MKNFFLLLILISLTGCGNSGGISVGALTALTAGTNSAGGDIVEASVAKEAVVMNTWDKYYVAMEKIHKASGVNIKFQMKELAPGVWVQTMEELTVRDAVALQTPPKEPSKHPVWSTLSHMTDVLAKYGLLGFGIYELSNAWEASVAGAGHTYQGPYNPINSNNTIGNDQLNTGEFVLRDKNIITDNSNETPIGFVP